jgi:predicted PurR-regulated permease PerM
MGADGSTSSGSGPEPAQVARSGARPKLIAIAGRTFVLALALVAGVWLLDRIWPAVMALVIALVLFGTFNPLVRYLERHRWRRGWGTAAVCFALLLVISGLALATMPALWHQVTELIRNLPRLQSKVASLAARYSLTKELAGGVKNLDLASVASGAALQAFAFSSQAATTIGYAVTSLVLAIYFLVNPALPRDVVFALTPRRHHVRLARILRELEIIVGGYVRGQMITSAAIFAFTVALLFVLRVPNGLALAAFAALADVIPFVGGLLAITPAALAAITRGPWTVVAVVGGIALYQELESRLIVPRVYGRVLRLSPPAVILALLVGGELMGILGALLALPVAASIRMIIHELRVELPGESPEVSGRRRAEDIQLEQEYQQRAAGAPLEKAAEVAVALADATRDRQTSPA